MRLLYALALGLALAAPARAQSDGTVRCWVFFLERPDGVSSAEPATGPATERALARRVLRGDAALGARMDAGVAGKNLEALRALGVEPLVESRWLNAVSARLTPGQRAAVAALPSVAGVRPVAHVQSTTLPVPPVPEAERWGGGLDYGPSAVQLATVNADRALELGYSGAGVRIGFLDTLFDFNHPALAHLGASGRLIGVQDFTGQTQTNHHGLNTSSVTFGRDDGDLVGPAHGAEAVAATTEYAPTETRSEEDFFIAGLEWLEAQGVDVVNVSLGYSDFDPAGPGPEDYTYANLNGDTTPFTRAVDRAAALGVLVVVSAGNEGSSSWRYITAPADADSALAVAAVRPDSVRASFSGIGPSADGRTKPDVAAQGTAIVFAVPGGYGFGGSGTSFAAPLVTGVAGQVLQANPGLAPMDVIGILRRTASQASAPDNFLGWGIVNAEAAVQQALADEPVPTGGPSFRVYPTVARSGGPLTVAFDAEAGAEVALFDVLGRRVATLAGGAGAGRATVTTTLPPLPAGSYVVRLTTGDESTAQRIVVTR